MIAGITEFKSFVGLSDVSTEDGPLLMCLVAADSIMNNYCNRNFEQRTYSRRLTPTDQFTVLVPDLPLVSVSGISAFQNILDTVGYPTHMEYVSFYRSGTIYSAEGVFADYINSTLVNYTAGFTPDDREWETLKWVQLEMAGQLFRGRGMLNLETYQAGGMQQTRIVATESTAMGGDVTAMFSPEVLIMLSMFAIRGTRLEY